MKKTARSVLAAIALAGAFVGTAGPASALVTGNLDVNPATATPAGVTGVTDIGTLGRRVTFNSNVNVFGANIDVTSNIGAYTDVLQVTCTDGTTNAQLRNGTNTFNGDILLLCNFFFGATGSTAFFQVDSL